MLQRADSYLGAAAPDPASPQIPAAQAQRFNYRPVEDGPSVLFFEMEGPVDMAMMRRSIRPPQLYITRAANSQSIT